MQDVGWSLRGPEVSRCPRRAIAGSHRTPAPVFVAVASAVGFGFALASAVGFGFALASAVGFGFALASAVGFGFALASAVGFALTREWQPRDGMPVRCLRGPLPVQ
jgi:hypothetical protein